MRSIHAYGARKWGATGIEWDRTPYIAAQHPSYIDFTMTNPPVDTRHKYVHLLDQVSDQSAMHLISITARLTQAGALNNLHIAISSDGGALDAASAIYRHLRALPIHVTTHNIGSIKSAALIVFLAGTERHAYPGTSFLHHPPVLLVPSSRLILDGPSLAEHGAVLQQHVSTYRHIFKEQTSIQEGPLDELMRGHRAYNAAEAKEAGIATHCEGAFKMQHQHVSLVLGAQ
jgi:ATP-dependent protease ClpP protease subunit